MGLVAGDNVYDYSPNVWGWIDPFGLCGEENSTSLVVYSGKGSQSWPSNWGFIGDSKRTHLMPGTKIDRYGSEYGKFVSPEGTPFPMRALPDEVLENSPYKVYEVLKPIEVDSGYIAPWFEKPGLGVQHKLPVKVKTLLNKGFIKEVK